MRKGAVEECTDDQNAARASFCFAKATTASSFFWRIPAARFGPARTRAYGRFPKANTVKPKTRRQRRGERCGRKLASSFQDNSLNWEPIGSRAANSFSAWATEGDFDPGDLKSNNCQVEWPPKSGRLIDVPEIDRAAWFSIEEALTKITKGQIPIVQALAKKLSDGAGERETRG